MPASDVFHPGNNAVITGAASGIGLAIVRLCMSHGMNVLLLDNNHDHLVEAERELAVGKGGESRIETYHADVSKLEDWTKLKQVLHDTLGSVQLLVLNAGVSGRGDWGDDEYFRKTIEVNLFGVINGINTFLPLVQKSAEAKKATSIVITGSKQGITNPPGNPAYNASKAAVRSLAEQLSYSLRDAATTAHLLVPGWTYTTIAGAGSSFKEKPAGAWAPSQVADYLFEKMREDKFYIICPDNNVSETLDKQRILYSIGDIVEERPPLSR